MKHFYHWLCRVSYIEGVNLDVLSLCYNSRKLKELEIYEDLEEALKSDRVLPDVVCIFGNEAQLEVYKKAWQNDGIKNLIQRGKKDGFDYVKNYIFFCWDRGSFSFELLEGSLFFLGSGFKLEPDNLLLEGGFSLINKNNVINIAPVNYSFKHPSGTRNNVFIQARDLATDESELYLVSYLIALQYYENLRDAQKVFIDTMGIYTYIKTAIDLCEGKSEISSFHSYDEIDNEDLDGGCIYFISASTTGNMALKISKRERPTSKVITLLDFYERKFTSVIYQVDKLCAFDIKEHESENLIELIGEQFSAKAKPPREVTIGIPHTPKHLSKFHEYLGFDVNGFSMSINSKPRLLSINASKLLNNDDFVKWLESEIDWHFPLTISHIVYAEDEASKNIAKEIEIKLLEKLKKESITTLALANVSELGDSVTGVVVVCSVSRNGGFLRDISRDLRFHIDSTIPRHFITPVAIPKSTKVWNLLVDFLSRNPTERNYGFSNWICLPIGDDHSPKYWNKLANLSNEIGAGELDGEGLLKVTSDIFNESLEQLEREINAAMKEKRFFKTPKDESLRLSEGYLFFAPDSVIAKKYHKVNQSALLLTKSAVIQCAREHRNPTRSLSPNGYESTVISPECFLRFNDPVLQACIIRACKPEELDYSASANLSLIMKGFLIKVFERNDIAYGEAAIEFALALAVGHLKISKKDLKDLLEHFKNMSILGSSSVLLGCLLIVDIKNKS